MVSGLTAPAILRRFKWTSVDSTTWIRQAGYGQIPIPQYTNGKPDFTQPPLRLPITKRSPQFRHLDTIKGWDRELVHLWFHDIGIDLNEGAEKPVTRWRVWVLYFVGVQKSFSVTIIFCINPSIKERTILEQGGATHFLLSYFGLQGKDPDKVEAFVRS